MLLIENCSTELEKVTISPSTKYETIVAVTDDSSNGRIDDIDRLNSNISKVNSTPAIGALKIPATAPAAPQPRSMVMFLYDRPKALATFEPIAAPV